VIQWLGLAVGSVAIYLAWRANHKSDDANRIAARALAISEREEGERHRERRARGRLVIAAEMIGYPRGPDGVIRLGGSHAHLRLAISVRNEGDSDAGRGGIDVAFPLIASDSSLRWTDASGRDLPNFPVHAARIGDTNVLSRELVGVAIGVPETVYARVPVTVPNGEDAYDYSPRITVVAEGADPVETMFPLLIGRDPQQ
jgi:hypothetical protein